MRVVVCPEGDAQARDGGVLVLIAAERALNNGRTGGFILSHYHWPENDLPGYRNTLVGVVIETKRRDPIRAGIDERTIHDFRRTAITNWAKLPELNAKDVQILAGRQDIKTTLEIYAIMEEGDVVERAKAATRRSRCRMGAED